MQSASFRLNENIIFVLLLALFIGSRFIGIGSQSLWLDEINLARIASELRFTGNILDNINSLFQLVKIEPHPPLYFLLCKIWTFAFGYSLISLRTLSIIWIVLLFIILGVWSRKEFGARFAWLLLLLLTFSHSFLVESQNFRPYTFNMLMGGAIGIAYLHFLKDTSLRWRLLPLCLWVLIASLSHYTAVIFALAVAGHQFFSGIYNQPKNYVRWFFNSVIIMLATLPALIWYGASFQDLYLRQVGDLSKTRDILDVISVFRTFTGFPGLIPVLLLPVVAGGDSIAQNVRNIWTGLAKDQVFVSCAGLGALFYVLIIASSFAQPSILQNKNFLIAFPVTLIAFARYVMIFADDVRIFRLAIVLAAIGFITFLVTGYPLQKTSYFDPWREDVRKAAALIRTSARPGDIVLFGTVSMTGYALQPTKTYLGLIEGRPEVLDGVEAIDFPPPTTYIVNQRSADIEQRQTILIDVLDKLKRTPSRRLFIEFPHEQALSRTETGLLVQSGFCILVSQYLRESVLIIENLVAPATCVTWSPAVTYFPRGKSPI
ncbi:MAG: glycosyltransferase family 39 protein [Alphaproteobacteria bacterium]